MNFTVVDKNAEDMLYALIIAEEQKSTSKKEKLSHTKFLQCQFFHIGMAVSLSDVRQFLDSMTDIDECTLYFCSDGDIIIRWLGGAPDTRDHLVQCITDKFGENIKKFMVLEEFFIDYDMVNSRDKLKSECTKKLKKQTRQGRELAKYFTDEGLISTLKKTVQLTKMQRAFRVNPHILIVEDQIFSQKILTSILKEYTCHIAQGAGEALLLYMEKCPDVVLLDLDLPDLSGHNFAKLISKIDEESFVVIVSSNQYKSDIDEAKKNNVRSFIAKPYEKAAILQVITQFKKTRKRSVA